MKNKSNEIGQSVLKGSLILVIANLLVKVIGALFKIPLTNLLGDEGMGYFGSAYTIYSGLFTVATAGLPVAIAKMVAESTSRNNLRELKRIHHVSYVMFAVVGVIGTAVLLFGAEALAGKYGEHAILCVKIVSPAIFFVAIMSVYRGFFQGLSDMYPTAFSELIESSVKLVAGILLAYFLLKSGLQYGAAGAISGVTIGSILGAIFLIMCFFKKRNKIYGSMNGDLEAPSVGKVVGRLILVALPVTVSASVFTITNLIDVWQIGDRLLEIALKIPAQQIENVIKTVDVGNADGLSTICQIGEKISGVMTEVLPADILNEAFKGVALKKAEVITTSLYGMYTSKVITMLNLLPALVVAVCLPLVPAIARAFAGKDYKTVANTTHLSVKFTVIFALPGAIGIGVLANPILRTLFGTDNAAFLLRLITPAIVCVSLVLVTNSILQATGNVFVPVINIAIAGVTKVIINYFLLAIPEVNINGVAVGTSACYLIYMTLNLFYVSKVTKPGFNVKDFVVKPVISAALMGVAVWAVNTVAGVVLGSGRMASALCTVAGIGVGVVVYLIALLKTKTIRSEEIANLPKGEKVVSVLKKVKLL